MSGFNNGGEIPSLEDLLAFLGRAKQEPVEPVGQRNNSLNLLAPNTERAEPDAGPSRVYFSPILDELERTQAELARRRAAAERLVVARQHDAATFDEELAQARRDAQIREAERFRRERTRPLPPLQESEASSVLLEGSAGSEANPIQLEGLDVVVPKTMQAEREVFRRRAHSGGMPIRETTSVNYLPQTDPFTGKAANQLTEKEIEELYLQPQRARAQQELIDAVGQITGSGISLDRELPLTSASFGAPLVPELRPIYQERDEASADAEPSSVPSFYQLRGLDVDVDPTQLIMTAMGLREQVPSGGVGDYVNFRRNVDFDDIRKQQDQIAGEYYLRYGRFPEGYDPSGFAGGGQIPMVYADGGYVPAYFLGGLLKKAGKGILKVAEVAAPLAASAIGGPLAGAGVGALISGIKNNSLKSALMGGAMGYLGGKGIKSLQSGIGSAVKEGGGLAGKGFLEQAALVGEGAMSGLSGLKDVAMDPAKMAMLYPMMGNLSGQIAAEQTQRESQDGAVQPAGFDFNQQVLDYRQPMPMSATAQPASAQGSGLNIMGGAGGGMLPDTVSSYRRGGENDAMLFDGMRYSYVPPRPVRPQPVRPQPAKPGPSVPFVGDTIRSVVPKTSAAVERGMGERDRPSRSTEERQRRGDSTVDRVRDQLPLTTASMGQRDRRERDGGGELGGKKETTGNRDAQNNRTTSIEEGRYQFGDRMTEEQERMAQRFADRDEFGDADEGAQIENQRAIEDGRPSDDIVSVGGNFVENTSQFDLTPTSLPGYQSPHLIHGAFAGPMPASATAGPQTPFSTGSQAAHPDYIPGLHPESMMYTGPAGDAGTVGLNPFAPQSTSGLSEQQRSFIERMGGADTPPPPTQVPLPPPPEPEGKAEGGQVGERLEIPSPSEVEPAPPEIREIVVQGLTGELPQSTTSQLFAEIEALYPGLVMEIANQIRADRQAMSGFNNVSSEGYIPGVAVNSFLNSASLGTWARFGLRWAQRNVLVATEQW